MSLSYVLAPSVAFATAPPKVPLAMLEGEPILASPVRRTSLGGGVSSADGGGNTAFLNLMTMHEQGTDEKIYSLPVSRRLTKSKILYLFRERGVAVGLRQRVGGGLAVCRNLQYSVGYDVLGVPCKPNEADN